MRVHKRMWLPWKFGEKESEARHLVEGKGLPSNLINCLCIHSRGMVFAGTLAGLGVLNVKKNEWRFVRSANGNGKHKRSRDAQGILLRDQYVSAVLDLGESVLVCTREGGAAIYDVGSARLKNIKTLESVNWATGAALAEDGSCRIATYGGGIIKVAQGVLKSTACAGRNARLGKRRLPSSPRKMTASFCRGQTSFRCPIKESCRGAFFLRDDWEIGGLTNHYAGTRLPHHLRDTEPSAGLRFQRCSQAFRTDCALPRLLHV